VIRYSPEPLLHGSGLFCAFAHPEHTSPKLILLAKSEIRMVYVQHEPEKPGLSAY
jgi:hypothetical protein